MWIMLSDAWSDSLGGPLGTQEQDSRVFVSPFQLRLFYDSKRHFSLSLLIQSNHQSLKKKQTKTKKTLQNFLDYFISEKIYK